MKIDGKDYDMRVSILPTMFGEKVVIRIADKEGFQVDKKDLGFFEDDLEKFDNIIAHPHGIVLVDRTYSKWVNHNFIYSVKRIV